MTTKTQPTSRSTPGSDSYEALARRFPLLPRSRPRCPPLRVRLDQIRTRARAASEDADQSLLRAAEALNLAALTASDCGLPDLASELCDRQAGIFLAHRPFDVATAKLALQPVINLGRLLTRDDDGTDAHQLFLQVFTAAKTRTTTAVNSLTIPFGELTLREQDHRELVQWLWSVLLSDGTKALAQAGRWSDAHQFATEYKGISQRLLDGRQIAILAHSSAGQHDRALALLSTSDIPTAWEVAVSGALNTLCRARAGQHSDTALTATSKYLAEGSGEEREPFAFRARLGLCVVDLASNSQTHEAIVASLVNEALQAEDAYIARDLLGHHTCTASISVQEKRDLLALVNAASLGKGVFTKSDYSELAESVRMAETALATSLPQRRGG